jgi:predicted nucleic acid-binding protein
MLIFDASTLILLTRIELIDIFLAASTQDAVIPVEVEKECCSAKTTLDSLVIRRAIADSKISVLEVKDRKLVLKLQNDFSLGLGEAEAIALAVWKKANLLAIDDKNGINACRLVGIAFTTAANILVSCRDKGLLKSNEALKKLILLERYGRYKKAILEEVRSRLEARK